LIKKVVIFIIISTLLLGCASNEHVLTGKTLDGIIEKTERLKNSEILHKEQIENGVLVFHIPEITSDSEMESQLGIEYFQETSGGWEMSYKGGSYFYGGYQDLYSGHFFLDENTPGFYGEVKDPTITKIVVKDVDGESEKQGNIISIQNTLLKDDLRIWYVLWDSNWNFVEVHAFDNNSNIVFEQVFNFQDQSSTGTFEDES
jgi:hypothetical protein